MTCALPRISSVRLVWSHDPNAEPDYLETSPESHCGEDGAAWSHVPSDVIERVIAEFGSVWEACVAYAQQDADRLYRFKGDDWWFEGCYAVAEILYDSSPGCFRLDKLRSAGLWGIESDSDKEYRQSVEADELADLSAHLSKFGVAASVEELMALI